MMAIVSTITTCAVIAVVGMTSMKCSRPGARESSSSAKGRSACDLVTAEEASAILGESIIAKEISHDATSSFCSYAPGGDRTKEIQLKVQWTGGKSAWDTNQTAVSLGGKLMGADRDPAAAGVMKSGGSTLGDKSSYNPILGAYVLKGDVLLEFNNLLVLRDARSKWEKLAATALSRL
jgi:hypothetical protein